MDLADSIIGPHLTNRESEVETHQPELLDAKGRRSDDPRTPST